MKENMLHCLILITKYREYRDAPAVRSCCCPLRGLEFRFQQKGWTPSTAWSSKRNSALFWPLQTHHRNVTCTQTETHKYKVSVIQYKVGIPEFIYTSNTKQMEQVIFIYLCLYIYVKIRIF